MENLPETNFQSSSNHNTGHAAQYSRLSTANENGHADAWVSGPAAVGQWLEADLSEQRTIVAVELRPRDGHAQWVSTYKLAFSNDGSDYSFVQIVNGEDRIFSGPSGIGDYVTSSFEPVNARYIRIYPLTYQSYMAVKWEVYGC